MSVEFVSSIGASGSGTQRAQATSADTQRVAAEATHQQNRLDAQRRFDAAEGIGAPDVDNHRTHDRDADGRRPWEFYRVDTAELTRSDAPAGVGVSLHRRDGDRGQSLDVTG